MTNKQAPMSMDEMLSRADSLMLHSAACLRAGDQRGARNARLLAKGWVERASRQYGWAMTR